MYEIEYKDGQKYLLVVNAIVQNMFPQVDGEGNMHFIFQDIVDHRYDGTEVNEQDAFTTKRTGKKRHIETTKGVEFHVQ